MRLSLGLSWASLFLSVQAIASAHIYLSGAPALQSPRTLSPDATRLLLARRLGLSRYHSLEGADEPTLKILNEFGGTQKTLLSQNEPWLNAQRNVIVVEDIETPGDFLDPMLHRATFTMSHVPHSSQTLHLVNDLFEQAKEVSYEGQDPCSLRFPDKGAIKGGFLSTQGGTAGACNFGPAPSRLLSLAPFLKDLSIRSTTRTAILGLSLSDFSNDNDLPQAKKDISKALSDILRPTSQTKDQETTVIILPPSNVKTKRTLTSPYGSYVMPYPQPLEVREGQSEAPLAPPSAPQTSLASHDVSTPHTLKASSFPKRGILPVCQTNLEKLIDVTNNCSGHGTPYLKNKDLKNKDEHKCYACKCRKTVLSRGEGKGVKTVYWAGPACSKKDVSVPFWLLVGISITMVATVSWGVGLLFSIGQEDLPSVISAGVVGPRAQK